jgi:hypothetical protein
MKKINLLLLGFGLMGLAGCAAMVGIRRVPGQGSVGVSSKPTDAEVYLNNMLVGRTPCRVPFTITIDTYTSMPVETYTIKIHKDGYKDDADTFQWVQVYRPNMLDPMGDWKFNVQTRSGLNNFDFVLKETGEKSKVEAISSGNEKRLSLPPLETLVGKMFNVKENRYQLIYEGGNTFEVDKETFDSIKIEKN